MKTTEENNNRSSTNSRETYSQEINLSNLLKDLMLFGPAPTRGREIAVVIVSLVGLAIVFSALQPAALVIVIASAVAVSLFAVRAFVGSRKWSRR